MPRLFPSIAETNNLGYNFINVDVLGRAFDRLVSQPPPLVHASFDAQCHLSEVLHDIMEYNQKALAHDEIGSLDDVRLRRAKYVRLMTWSESLPAALRVENRSPQTSYVRYRLLHPQVLLLSRRQADLT